MYTASIYSACPGQRDWRYATKHKAVGDRFSHCTRTVLLCRKTDHHHPMRETVTLHSPTPGKHEPL